MYPLTEKFWLCLPKTSSWMRWGYPWKLNTTGLSLVNRESKSSWDMPHSCSSGLKSFIKLTTLTKRTRNLGRLFLKISVAANASSVGTSPAQAIITSGLCPRSLDAHSQALSPNLQWTFASSIESHCGEGCFPATTTLTRSYELKQRCITQSRQFASGGRYTRT